MKEINEIVNNHIKNMQSEGLLQKAIEEGVQKAVMKAIDEQFNSWGGITKQLEGIFKESLKVDPKALDLQTYNSVMKDAIHLRMKKHLEEEAATKMLESLEKLFMPMPAEMKTDEFIKMICEYWKSDDPCSCFDDMDEYATVEVKFGEESYNRDSCHLKIWKKKETSSYSSRSSSPDVDIYIINGVVRLKHEFNPTHLHEEEGVIVKAYAAGTKLIDIADYDPDDYEYELRGEYY